MTSKSLIKKYSPLLVGHSNALAENAFAIGALAALKEMNEALTAQTTPHEMIAIMHKITDTI